MWEFEPTKVMTQQELSPLQEASRCDHKALTEDDIEAILQGVDRDIVEVEST